MADLETPAPPPPEPIAAAPVEPAPVPEPVTDPVEDAAVDVGGQKMVSLNALREERDKAKQFREKAQAYDNTITYLQQAQPYIEFLKANPDFMTRPAAAPAAAAPVVDEQATELARTLDLYTPDGKPDTARAQKLMTVVDRISDAKAEARVRPLAESTTRERAAHNYQRALVTQTKDGRVPDRATLDAIWARVDPNITATEEGATALVMLALGAGSFAGQPAIPQPPNTPPVVTERPGSRTGRAPTMTALDESIANLRGRSADDWSKLTRTFTAGRTNVLED